MRGHLSPVPVAQAVAETVGDLTKWVRVRSHGAFYRLHPSRYGEGEDGWKPITAFQPGDRVTIWVDRLPMVVEVL